MKKNILHIIWSTNTGGIERLVIQLWKEQQKDASLHVEVFAGQPGGTLWHEFNETGTVHSGPFKSGMDFSVAKLSATVSLFSKFDILHFHSFHPATAYAAVKSGKKIIYTEHGNFGFGRKAKLSDNITRWLLKRFLHHSCHYITFNSEFSQKTATARYGLSAQNAEVVYNGIELNDVTFTAPVDEDLLLYKNNHFTIGCIGRLATVKRIDRLISVAAKMKDRIDFRLIIIGDGPLEETLKAQVTSHALNDRIYFAGRRTDVKRFYHLFDVFVLPSANEAFGLVVAEAMYAGTPSLAFNDAGGPVEIIALAEPENICKDESAMANRIITLQSPEERNRKSAERKAAAAHFNIQRMQESFSQIYQQL